ncbi:hypothetical protein [Streptomyces sp. NPDC050856]|uniref:hypothetical protein n=1 Tax=Streptomyces sp. NPDC050856 TaxID=3154939 RepID=UPI0033D5CF2C
MGFLPDERAEAYGTLTEVRPRARSSNGKPPQGAVDRDAYAVCVLEQPHRVLNRRDVFAARRTGGPTRA